jgi:hypothetical protein
LALIQATSELYTKTSNINTKVQSIHSTPLASFTMPGEVIDRPNPKAEPSHIPDIVQQLQAQFEHASLDQSICDSLYKFRRAAAYIAAGEDCF